MTDTLDPQSLRQAADAAKEWPSQFTEQFNRVFNPDTASALLDRLERAEADLADLRTSLTHYQMAADAEAKFADEWRERALKAEAELASRSPAGAAVPEVVRKALDIALDLAVEAADYVHKVYRGHKGKKHAAADADVLTIKEAIAAVAAPAAPSQPHADLLKAAANVVMQLPLREGFGSDECKAMAITANAAILNLAAPSAPTGQTNPTAQEIRAVAEPAPVAQASQQPVGWLCPNDPDRATAFSWKAEMGCKCGAKRVPVFAAPLQQAEGWISVDDERKPEVCKPILVAVQCQSYSERDNGEYEQVTFTEVTEGEYSKYSDDIERRFEPFQGQMADRQYVSHWMPLPTPPLPAQSQPAGPATPTETEK